MGAWKWLATSNLVLLEPLEVDKMGKDKHPMAELPEKERIDYLKAVATIAASDGSVQDAEVDQSRSLCKTLELSDKATGKVLAALYDPDAVPLKQILGRYAHQEIRFTLLTDALFLAYADGPIVPKEETAIKIMAGDLRIDDNQIAALRQYVEATRRASEGGNTNNDLKKLGAEVAAQLASVGVPLTAVAISGSVFGLSAAGVTSGLAALGLGLGMVPGLGVAVGIGVASYLGVKWVYDTFFGDEE